VANRCARQHSAVARHQREFRIPGEAMINVKLDNEESTYRPGDTISGSVEWSEEEGDSLEVRLIWFTQGKGDRDFELISTHTVTAFGPSGSERFQFSAPHRPQSFAGKLISLQWAIEAIAFPSQNTKLQNLTISSTGKEIEIFAKDPLV